MTEAGYIAPGLVQVVSILKNLSCSSSSIVGPLFVVKGIAVGKGFAEPVVNWITGIIAASRFRDDARRLRYATDREPCILETTLDGLSPSDRKP